MRLPADERRRQLLAVACDLFARTGFHDTSMDDIAEAAGRHQAGALPALPEQARALRRAARRHRSPAPRPARRGDRPRDVRPRAGRGRVPRVLPVRGRRPLVVPPAVRRVDPQRPRVRAHGRRRSSHAAADTISTLIDLPTSDDQRRVLAYAIVGMAESVGRRALHRARAPTSTATSSPRGSPSSRGSASAACAPRNDRPRRRS